MSRKIAILGLGSRGSAWSQAFREAGWRVSGFDPDPLAGPSSKEGRGWHRESAISSTVAFADWVLLALPERLELVQKMIQRAQAEAPAGSVIAVASEAFDVEEVQSCAIRPGRIVLLTGAPAMGVDLNVSSRNAPEMKVDVLAILSEVCPAPAETKPAGQSSEAKSA